MYIKSNMWKNYQVKCSVILMLRLKVGLLRAYGNCQKAPSLARARCRCFKTKDFQGSCQSSLKFHHKRCNSCIDSIEDFVWLWWDFSKSSFYFWWNTFAVGTFIANNSASIFWATVGLVSCICLCFGIKGNHLLAQLVIFSFRKLQSLNSQKALIRIHLNFKDEWVVFHAWAKFQNCVAMAVANTCNFLGALLELRTSYHNFSFLTLDDIFGAGQHWCGLWSSYFFFNLHTTSNLPVWVT